MDKLKIGILFGGCSEEHAISIKSAREVAHNLDCRKYDPVYIGITKTGEWKLCNEPNAAWENESGLQAILSPDRSTHGLLVLEHGQYKTIYLDVVFPVLHGRMGEDGSMQGLLELSGIPYVGCNVQSSVIGMDKSLAYIVASNAGIATPDFWTIGADEDVDADQFSYPVFVKPARSGSSFAVSKVYGKETLFDAICNARKYDSKVLIEKAITGSEVGCAVMGNGAELRVGEVDQIKLAYGFFKIHQEANPEQASENSSILVPADIPAAARQQVQETAKAVYRALDCQGLARVDMFYQENGVVVLNEINTLPGFTTYSRYPRMMAAAGLPLSDVIDRIIALALKG